MSEEWGKVVRSETVDGHEIEMRYREFGKGRAKVKSWRIYRDGAYAGYAAIEADAAVNFERVAAGYVLNTETGRYELAE